MPARKGRAAKSSPTGKTSPGRATQPRAAKAAVAKASAKGRKRKRDEEGDGDAGVTAAVTRDDPNYPSMATQFNERFIGDPDVIFVCSSTEEVCNALQRAVDNDQHVAVRSGGHCYENFVASKDVRVVIDLCGLNRVYKEEERFVVEGGCTLYNVYNTLCRLYGVTIPGGSCYSVGVGGHVTGGGYGLLSRKYGLTVDYLSEVEVVVVTQDKKLETLRVSKNSATQEEKELFWAHTGGGGGNFGIVTRFWFENLPPVPGEAWWQTVSWKWTDLEKDGPEKSKEAFTHLVTTYGEFWAEHSQPGDPYSDVFTLFCLNAQTEITLKLQSVNDKGDAHLKELVDAMAGHYLTKDYCPQTVRAGHYSVTSSTDTMKLPWLHITQYIDGENTGWCGKYKSAYMKKPFPAQQIDVMWRTLRPNSNAPKWESALVQIDSYGGEVNSVAPDDTAICQRSSIMKLQYQVYWEPAQPDTEKVGQECLDWIRTFYYNMYPNPPPLDGPQPNEIMDGCYVNYCDADLVDWAHLYYGHAGYRRLQAVKQRWDPLDIFHHAQSVRALVTPDVEEKEPPPKRRKK